MSEDLLKLLDEFVIAHQQAFPDKTTEHDPDWPSSCEIGLPWRDAQGGKITAWQPVRRQPSDDFSGLENALDLQIHPDIKAYYGRYWSEHLDAQAPDGELNLLFLWNEDDRDRLIENLIGHAVACRHNKTPFSVFFAITEPDGEYYLTVNNATGEVQLEQPAKQPVRVIAPSLASFISDLKPANLNGDGS